MQLVPGLGKASLAMVMLFQKTFMKDLIFVASSLALLVERWSSMALKTELWSVQRQGIYIILISGNPGLFHWRSNNPVLNFLALFILQVDESSRAQWQEEKTRLVQDQHNQLERLRSECDSKFKEQCARMERDLGTRMNSELQKARSGWEKEQQHER